MDRAEARAELIFDRFEAPAMRQRMKYSTFTGAATVAAQLVGACFLISPIAMEEGVRFAIREGGRTVGAGVVSKVLE